MVTPAGSGLMQRELAAGAAELGVGCRRGERLYALKAMMDRTGRRPLLAQDLAACWAGLHATAYGGMVTGRWWSHRARDSSEVLTTMAGEVS